MPLTLYIPLGLLIAVVGAILFFATNHKKIAKIILGVGAGIVILALTAVILAVNSGM